jgi:hypothetical protein
MPIYLHRICTCAYPNIWQNVKFEVLAAFYGRFKSSVILHCTDYYTVTDTVTITNLLASRLTIVIVIVIVIYLAFYKIHTDIETVKEKNSCIAFVQ